MQVSSKTQSRRERKAEKKVEKKLVSSSPPSYAESVKNSDMELAAANPYLQAVLDPFNVHGAKIPDLIMFPSSPVTIVDRRTITVNAAGIAYITYGSGGALASVGLATLVPVNNNSAGSEYTVGMINGSGALSSDLFPAVNGGTKIKFSQWDSTSAAIPSAFQRARLVSAGLAITFNGTPLSSKGKFTLAFAPRNSLRSEIGSGAITIDRISKIPGAKVIPINELKGGTVLYKPLDNISLDYVNIADFLYDVGASGNFATNLALAAASGGELYAICDGCNPADTFQVTAVFNYEAIPKLNTFNLVNATPSPSDPLALSHAVNVLQTTPTTVGDTSHMQGLIRGERTVKMPATNNGNHVVIPQAVPIMFTKPSFMDKIMKGLPVFEKGVGKAVNFIQKIAPLAKTILSAL